jgi:hypothetical protein
MKAYFILLVWLIIVVSCSMIALYFYSKALRKLKSDFFRIGSFAACCIIIFLVPYLFLVEIAMHVGVKKSNFEFFVVLLVWVIIILVYSLYLRSKGAFKIHK